jgi:hypothetical protein
MRHPDSDYLIGSESIARPRTIFWSTTIIFFGLRQLKLSSDSFMLQFDSFFLNDDSAGIGCGGSSVAVRNIDFKRLDRELSNTFPVETFPVESFDCPANLGQ